MSLMTESLLLHAQSLRAKGEADESIDVLRVVISQCISDIDASSSFDHRHPPAGDRAGSEEASRMRESSSLALATMLLQRAGRRRMMMTTRRRRRASVSDADDEHDDENENDDGRDDEYEADAILDGLGYRTRLSTMAFGYPSCSSCRLPPRLAREDVVAARERSSSPPPSSSSPSRVVGFRRTVVVDDAMPASMFGALRRAFRTTGSRYWSEFYCRGNDGDSTNDREGDGAMRRRRRRRRRRNVTDDGRFFASHNISLPASGGGAASRSSSSSSLADHLRRSKSLLEQAAVLARRRLLRRFPEVIDATSVEVWCHRRPRDGGHRLHYDMDEILLWERRRKEAGRRSDGREGEGEIRGDGATKTTTTTIGDDAAADAGGRSRKRPRTRGPSSSGSSFGDDDGISCPIVSCVLTICVPDDACHSCGGAANGAPTIVCDQSILSRRRGNDDDDGSDGTRRKNVGYLCFPRPNRLLAFDGSLLHGVVPGMPLARPRKPAEPSSEDNEGSRSSDHSFDDDYDDDEDGGSDYVCDHRITLMMGFWRDVRTTTTTTIGDDASSSSGTTAGPRPIGPNVPYVPRDGTWTDEFVSISLSGSDLADIETMSATTDESSDLVVVDPLWIPIVSGINANEGRGGDKEIQPSVRFFLKSLDPRNIDDEILSGT